MGRDASKPALRIKIEQIFTEETVYRRAEFDGRAVLKLLASDLQSKLCGGY